jgi:hypothetical protein
MWLASAVQFRDASHMSVRRCTLIWNLHARPTLATCHRRRAAGPIAALLAALLVISARPVGAEEPGQGAVAPLAPLEGFVTLQSSQRVEFFELSRLRNFQHAGSGMRVTVAGSEPGELIERTPLAFTIAVHHMRRPDVVLLRHIRPGDTLENVRQELEGRDWNQRNPLVASWTAEQLPPGDPDSLLARGLRVISERRARAQVMASAGIEPLAELPEALRPYVTDLSQQVLEQGAAPPAG